MILFEGSSTELAEALGIHPRIFDQLREQGEEGEIALSHLVGLDAKGALDLEGEEG